MSVYFNVAACFGFLLPEFNDFELRRWIVSATLSWSFLLIFYLTTCWTSLSYCWRSFIIINSYVLACNINVLTRNRSISHILIGITVLAAVQVMVTFSVTATNSSIRLYNITWYLYGLISIIWLMESFKDYISIQDINELFVNIFEKLTWLRLNNTNVVDTATANFNNLSVHQRFHKFRGKLHSINFIIICRI